MCIYLRLPEAVEDYLEDDYDKFGHRSQRLLINPLFRFLCTAVLVLVERRC